MFPTYDNFIHFFELKLTTQYNNNAKLLEEILIQTIKKCLLKNYFQETEQIPEYDTSGEAAFDINLFKCNQCEENMYIIDNYLNYLYCDYCSTQREMTVDEKRIFQSQSLTESHKSHLNYEPITTNPQLKQAQENAVKKVQDILIKNLNLIAEKNLLQNIRDYVSVREFYIEPVHLNNKEFKKGIVYEILDYYNAKPNYNNISDLITELCIQFKIPEFIEELKKEYI